ncbi:MAG: hypothetical protein KDK55_01980 [Chlamydiia bacterium]|nr:hypothetical protein [Chlamydiia bacterium]
MSTVILTIIAAIFLMVGVVILLGLSWILTGKSRLKKECGQRPCDKKIKTTDCMICGAKKISNDEKKTSEKKE